MSSIIEIKTLTTPLSAVSFASAQNIDLDTVSFYLAKAGYLARGYDWELQTVPDNQIIFDGYSLSASVVVGDRVAIHYDLDGIVTLSKSQRFQLSTTDLTNGYVTLTDSATSANLNLTILGQPYQIQNSDYILINGTKIQWSGFALSSEIINGDILEATYDVADDSTNTYKIVEQFVVDESIVDSKQIKLSYDVLEAGDQTYYTVNFEIRNAGGQIYNQSFEVENDILSWYDYDIPIQIGDVLTIIYFTDRNRVFESDIFKINEKLQITNNLKTFAANPKWVEEYSSLWEFVSAANKDIGRVVFERTANFVQNLKDIDTCNLHSLHSMSEELDQSNLFSYDLAYPADLERLMNIFSTNRSISLVSGYLLHNDTLDKIYRSQLAERSQVVSDTDFLTSFELSGLRRSTDTTSAEYLSPDDVQRIKFENTIIDDRYVPFIKDILHEHLVNHTRSFYFPSDIIVENDKPNLRTSDVDSISSFDLVREQQSKDSGIFKQYKNDWNKLYAINSYYDTQEYVGFLDDIIPSGGLRYCSTTSAQILDDASSILTNICLKGSYYRDSLKKVMKKYSMIGTSLSLEGLFVELIKRGFSNREEWRYIPSVGTSQYASYMPSLNSLSGLSVKVIEYWDTTEYLNINAPSPYKTGFLGYQAVSGITGDFTSDGFFITGYYNAQEAVSGGDPSLGMTLSGGNDRYWEASYNYYVAVSEHLDSEVEDFYYNLGLGSTLSGSTLSDYMVFQKALWNTFAVSGWDRMATIPDLSGTPTSTYSGTAPSEIPSNGWLISPTSLSALQYKYTGIDAGKIPPANVKNINFPTVAPQPFIWNLVKKAYDRIPPLIQTVLPSNIVALQWQDLISNDGILKDSWKYTHHEYNGYQTYYEESRNLDYNQFESANIDRDGTFYATALSAYILGHEMSGYYTHINPIFKNGLSYKVSAQNDFFFGDVISLSGTSMFDPENTVSGILPYRCHEFNEILCGKFLYNYDVDINGHHWMLYKDHNDFDTLGQIWVRYNNHPLAFPATYGFVENITSLDAASGLLVSLGIATASELSFTPISSDTQSTFYWNMNRTGDAVSIANWYGQRNIQGTLSANVFEDTLRINDYNLQQVYVEYPLYQIDYMMFKNTYDFAIENECVILIGKTAPAYDENNVLTTYDRIVIFNVDDVDIAAKTMQEICSDNECEIEQTITAYSVLTNMKFIPKKYDIPNNIRSYAGYYVQDQFIVFVFIPEVRAGEIDIEMIYYDRDKREFVS